MLRKNILHKILLISVIVLLGTGEAKSVSTEINRWTSNGPEGGKITALAIDPLTPTTLYAGTYQSGVFKSTGRGESWTNLSIVSLVFDFYTW